MKIANEIDESVPGGANWHRELLDQMILEIDGIRPAGLSIDLKEELEDYRGLRHVKGVEEIGFLIININ